MEESKRLERGGKDTTYDSFCLRQMSYAATYPQF